MLLLGMSGALVRQGGAAAQEKQGEKAQKAPAGHSEPESGAQMYKDYCAACHGTKERAIGQSLDI